eukprot:15367143-Ditylum_brightwellii.AAC.3
MSEEKRRRKQNGNRKKQTHNKTLVDTPPPPHDGKGNERNGITTFEVDEVGRNLAEEWNKMQKDRPFDMRTV